jgi:hypothetical protein
MTAIIAPAPLLAFERRCGSMVLRKETPHVTEGYCQDERAI